MTKKHASNTLKMSALALAVSNALLVAPVDAATITVDNVGCKLIDAIVSANADDNAGVPGCVSGNGADTIELNADVELNALHSDYSGLPLIESEVTINGNNHSISRTGVIDFRIMNIGYGANVQLNDLTMSNGYTDGYGGAIQVDQATVTLSNTEILSNGGY